MADFTGHNNFRIFPNSQTEAGDGTEFVTEYNISSIVNKLIEEDGFVISSSFPADNGVFQFNIQGYYIEVKNDVLTSILNELWNRRNNESEDERRIATPFGYFKIEKVSSTDFKIYAELRIYPDGQGQESYNSIYKHNTSDDANVKITPFWILRTSSGTSWKIPSVSRVKFHIDDGELE